VHVCAEGMGGRRYGYNLRGGSSKTMATLRPAVVRSLRCCNQVTTLILNGDSSHYCEQVHALILNRVTAYCHCCNQVNI
jgi:hypothetical protein